MLVNLANSDWPPEYSICHHSLRPLFYLFIFQNICEKCKVSFTHVLAHFVKSFRAYNVKSYSTLFLGKIQSNFKIYFPNPRFLIQLGCNLITNSWDYHEWDFSDPCIIKLRKRPFKCHILFWKNINQGIYWVLVLSGYIWQ